MNPNFQTVGLWGDISRDEELASAAKAAGYSYGQLLQRIVNLGLKRDPPVRRSKRE